MEGKICATCKYAQGFGVGPGISGSDEGVKCTNSKFARYLDSLQKSDSYEKEYNMQGFINVFRVEAVATKDSDECRFWAGKKVKRGSGKN
jgi:hypothetical protein